MLFRLLSLSLLSLLLLGGCSKYISKLDKVLPDNRKEYQESESLPDLEVPPDLTNESIDDELTVPEVNETGTASFSTYQERVVQQKQASKYAELGDVSAIVDLAGEQLITVDTSMEKTWNTLQDFWETQGYELDLNDQELGVIETTWKEDDEALQRDKYKVFIEPAGKVGATTIYLSHLGEDQEDGSWVERPRDLPKEKSMALRIQSTLSDLQERAVSTASSTETSSSSSQNSTQPAPRPKLVDAGEGKIYLSVPGDFDSSWPIIGKAIENTDSLAIEESDIDKGTYSIAYNPDADAEEGVLSKLAFWKGGSEEFELSVTGLGDKTEVLVLDEDGKWDDSDTARSILLQIKDKL